MRKLLGIAPVLFASVLVGHALLSAGEPEEKKPAAAPEVAITVPRGGWTTERIVEVAGTISDPSVLRLTLVYNGVPMTIRASEGQFKATLVLSPGSNCIQAIAANKAGLGQDSTTVYARVPAKDMKVTLTWDTDATDVDLHVTDPAGEECFYSHTATKMGGNLDVDITDGFGPETFTLARAERGKYYIAATYYSAGGRAQTKCRVDVILFEGTAKERRETHNIVLTRGGEETSIAEVFVR